MDTTPRLDGTASETIAEKRRRLFLEAEMIAEAEAEIDAGMLVDETEVDAWIDSLGTATELPIPKPGRSTA
ncbi:MAG TPA: hypothetical protein VG308_20170 [Stellaceae bacterium]|jgi:predicted transcriptional regulator|nr:hypothetical protein [Stellaceae bacterium]